MGRQGRVRSRKILSAIGLLLILTLVSFPVDRAVGGDPIPTWSATTSYPVSLDDESCALAGASVYCVGGFVGDTYTTNGSGSTASVFYSNPSRLGGIAAWENTTSYPVIVNTESCVVTGDNLYCIGGYTNTGATDAVYYSSLLSSGGLSGWNATIGYPVRVFGQSCVPWDGYIYCVGGYNASGLPMSSAYYTRATDHGITGWNPTASYPTNVTSQSCVAAAGRMYCIGGITDASPPVSDAVYYADLSAGGVDRWTETASYPTNIDIESCVATNASMYCVGGGPDFTATARVYTGVISASGGVSAWSETVAYPDAVGEQSCVLSWSSFIYCIGGSPDASDHTSSVYYLSALSLVSTNAISTIGSSSNSSNGTTATASGNVTQEIMTSSSSTETSQTSSGSPDQQRSGSSSSATALNTQWNYLLVLSANLAVWSVLLRVGPLVKKKKRRRRRSTR